MILNINGGISKIDPFLKASLKKKPRTMIIKQTRKPVSNFVVIFVNVSHLVSLSGYSGVYSVEGSKGEDQDV